MSNPIPKPKQSLFRYSWLASTYRPPELGPAEIQILDLFARSDSQSAYGILKELKTIAKVMGRESSPAYKDVHKRVKRLLQLKLIYQTENHFERGAKHYRITDSGLITTLDKNIGSRYLTLDERNNYEREYGPIIYNTHNPVIQTLLYELLEQRTVDHIHELPRFLAEDLKSYLHECCSYTTDVCRQFWYGRQKSKITDILPSDDILQKYMGHLAGEPLEQPVLGEIKEYEQRLKKRIGDNEVKDKELATVVEAYNYDWGVRRGEVEAEDYIQNDLHRIPNQAACFAEKPPFPLLDMYVDIVSFLDPMVEEKTRSFVFNIIIKMGEKIKEGKWSTDVDYDRSEINRHALYYLVTDKRFMGLVNAFKSVLDMGCKHLIDAGK